VTVGPGPAVRAALGGHEPTAEQWRALTHPLEPVHLIAGAGSGKTAIMAARITWIVETQGISPSQVLGLTFTNKAAAELGDRVTTALAARGAEALLAGEPTVQTYHAFSASIVREHGLLVGVESEAGLLSEAQQWQLVLSCLDELPAFEAIELRSSMALVRATLRLSESLADHVIGTADVEAAADRVLSSGGDWNDDIVATAAKRKELCRAVTAYQAIKGRINRIDFGDQVTKAVEVLEGHEDVCRGYRDRWPVVLLDEYQDTNVAQRRLIQALVGPGGAVTAVGDARQAIYAFRGATMYNLIGFPGHFPRSGGTGDYEEISLSQNFRSGARILAAANDVVGRIPAERRPGVPLAPTPQNGEGRVSLGLFGDERGEADWIAGRCDALHGTRLGPERPPVAWRDIAILVRRRASMAALLEALEARDIPVEVVGLGGLLATPEVTEVVAWLRCLDTKPAANRWLARVLLGPRWRVHYRDLALCARWAAERNLSFKLNLAGGDELLARDMEPGDVGFSLLESLEHLDDIDGLGADARRRLGDFRARLESLRAHIGAPLLDLVQQVIVRSGIHDALESSSARGAPASKQNLANFLDHVAAFAPVEGEATLRSLLAYLDAAEDAEETLEATQPAEHDSVKLMTVHAAKGLEFECVFVPSVAAGVNRHGVHVWSIFPNERSSNPLTSYAELPYEVREDSSELPAWGGSLKEFADAVRARVREDEHRLFYVALTRAKQWLAVTAAWWYGRDATPKGPSLFWEELDGLHEGGLVDVVARAEQPPDNPLIGALEDRRAWPPEPRAGADDPLWPRGWGAVAEDVLEGRVPFESLLADANAPDGAAALELLARTHADLELIERGRAAAEPARPLPDILSATTYAELESKALDPGRLSRPLPTRPSPAARLGTEIHRLIEERARDDHPAWTMYPEEAELDEPQARDGRGEVAEKLARWNALGFDRRTVARMPSGEPMIELPFTLRIGDRIIRGRVDAVYETDDGGFEIVDVKSGGRFEPGDDDQLAIYARALDANGLLPEGRPVTLTYAFLDGGEPLSRRYR
jgi:DNA helicase II / ATP-dependent DNA helicase PcrA